MELKKILCAVDLKDSVNPAVEYAKMLSELSGASISAIYVVSSRSAYENLQVPVEDIAKGMRSIWSRARGDMDAFVEKQFPGKGEEYATKLRDNTIALYKKCAEYALSRGIIIADTKFEFGLDEEGNVILGDEMLTPDSSRFWPLEGYEAGHGQPSFDKQFVRNWLKANPDSDFNLPQDIIDKTIAKYEEAYEMLTGKKL